MNPYASILAGRDARQVIAATPGELAGHVRKLGPAGLAQALAPGKWSVREILCHLADCEVVFTFRLRQALAEEHHVIQPFDQDRWAAAYRAYDAAAALALFSALRGWNIAFIRGLKPEDLSKRLSHPERGEMPMSILVETMAGHDLNHLGQIATIARRVSA
ncbi:MAG: DinB family protein [Terriglobales bacterium]